jgi:hypothetical protein
LAIAEKCRPLLIENATIPENGEGQHPVAANVHSTSERGLGQIRP